MRLLLWTLALATIVACAAVIERAVENLARHVHRRARLAALWGQLPRAVRVLVILLLFALLALLLLILIGVVQPWPAEPQPLDLPLIPGTP